MRSIILLISLIYLSSIKAEIDRGVYSCPVTFSNGAFETLSFEFSDDQKNPVFLLKASQTTPNFMMIKLENEEDQTATKLSEISEDIIEAYEINWKNTWYFGSILRLKILNLIKDGFDSEIEFYYNEKAEEIQRSTCIKEKFPTILRSAISQ